MKRFDARSGWVIPTAMLLAALPAATAHAYTFSIRPPESLSLVDGANGLTNITNGFFNLTGLIGYSPLNPDGVTLLDPLSAGDDITRTATIGSGVNMGLLEVDSEYEVLKYSGFFSSSVLANDANFEGITGVVGPGGPSEYTIFLPFNTTQPLRTQLTTLELEPLEDNTDRFVEVGLLSVPQLQIANDINDLLTGAEVFQLNGDPTNNRGPWFVGIGGPSDPGGSNGGGGTSALNLTQANMKFHGTLAQGGCIPGSLCTATWNGGGGDYNTAGNWDIGLVPFNGNFSGSTFNVIVNGGSSQLTQDVDIVNLTVNGGELVIGGRLDTFTNNNTITNAGTIRLSDLAGGAANEILGVTGGTSISGGGDVVLESATSIIQFVSGTGAVTNVDNTIRGQGSIGSMTLINEGTIRADGGRLRLNSVTLDNNAGTLEAAAGAVLEANATAITGGALAGAGTFEVSGGSLNDVAVSTAVAAAGNQTRLSGTITNTGLLTFTDQVNTSRVFGLGADVTVSLTGNGELQFDGTNSAINGFSTTRSTIQHGADHTIRGDGAINSLTLNNAGLIRAQGGSLNLNSVLVNSAPSGRVEIAASGNLTLSSTTITGGTLDGQAGSTTTGGTLDSLTVTGTVANAGSATRLTGDIDNQGTLTYADLPNNSRTFSIGVDDTATLGGGGQLVLTDVNTAVNGFSQGRSILINGPSHTIRGDGAINSVTIDNQGTVLAEAGTLSINSVSLNNAPSGRVEIAASGNLTLSSTTITGGTLDGQAGSTTTGGTLDSLTVTGTVANAGSATRLTGDIDNQGTLTYADLPNNSRTFSIGVDDTATLGGGGQLVLTDVNTAVNGFSPSRTTLTNSTGHTIRGAGSFNSLSLVNPGTVIAEGGTLNLNSLTYDGTGGRVEIANDGVLQTSGTTLTGGTLHGQATGRLLAGTLTEITLTGTVANGGSNTRLSGNLDNQGTLTFADLPNTSRTYNVGVDDDATLNGPGDFVFTDINAALNGFSADRSTLTNSINHTIRGQGTISSITIINAGTIRAEGGELALNSVVLNSQSGTLGAAPLSTLTFNSGTISGNATIDVQNSGVVRFVGTNIDGATFQGNGQPQISGGSLANISNSGTIAATGSSTTLAGTIDNNGVITFSDFSTQSRSFVVGLNETVDLDGSGHLVMTDINAAVNGQGFASSTVNNGPSHTIRGQGSLTSLSLNNAGTLAADDGQLSLNNVALNNTGTVTVDDLLTFSGGSFTNNTDGVVNGAGQVVVTLLDNVAGTIAPGTSPGVLTVTGDVTQGDDATLAIELAGTTPGEGYDVLAVDGTLTLDGVLDVSLIDGFSPAGGNAFDIALASQGITGGFDSVLLPVLNGNLLSRLVQAQNVLTLEFFLPADYNDSGQVEQGDLDLVLQNWGRDTDVTGVPTGWVNDLPSGQIEQTELDGVLQSWGSTAAPDFRGVVVPEPASMILLTAGMTCLRRRHAT